MKPRGCVTIAVGGRTRLSVFAVAWLASACGQGGPDEDSGRVVSPDSARTEVIEAAEPPSSSSSPSAASQPAVSIPEGPAAVPDVPAASVPLTRDSAGVTIVEITGDDLAALPVWRIADEPLLVIGETDGELPDLFAGLGPSGVEVLSDGRIAIVDGGGAHSSRELRVFDESGRFLWRAGGAGEGPGEFAAPPMIRGAPGGGLVAVDPVTRRVTVFDSSGHRVEDWSLGDRPCPEVPCAVRGVLSDGTVLLQSAERPPALGATAAGRTVEGLQSFYSLATREGMRDLATLPLPVHTVLARDATEPVEIGGRVFQRTSVMALPPLLGAAPGTRVVTGQDHFVLTSSVPFEFRIFDRAGMLLRIVRVLREPVAITSEEREAILDRAPENADFEGRDVATHRPEFGNVRFGDGDDLWISDFRHPALTRPDLPERIMILGIDGAPVAIVEVPVDPIHGDQRRSVPHEVRSGREHFRLITVDALGVERLVVFGILREAP